MYPNFYLPQQQVMRANGKASIEQLRMAPNSSALILDETAPLVWLCTTDSLGNVSATPYDIAIHQEKPPVDMNTLEQRLANLEAMIMEVRNAKPDAPKTRKQPDKESV